ncbi:MAG: hypothetical protein CO094_08900 [Anaerolineae bacterium CG_4_9_14_3_um_filter_57_17]|nr:ATP-binding protein [bacterium]NCT21674.1 ATP-binding protein [bacterium]OIO86734.1 MAG: hypothetical protein AUK01_02230 [Anaerolineae bacterium CG2_30_57_67]PJB65822.1 MAG: hypothetical protein CO094_08900 [Anaerolineae bacterium CG_4_9_14_3_um_filter_57_17]
MIQQITEMLPTWLTRKTAALAIPADLQVRGSGIAFVGQTQTDYLWTEMTEVEHGRTFTGYRVVRLMMLKFLPLEASADSGLLQKMRSILRGLAGAQVNLVYLAGGVFGESPLGIVQCYGVTSFADTLEEAARESARDLGLMEGALKAEFRQMRLEPISARLGNWVYDSLEKMPHALVTVGHPDPRENSRSPHGTQNPLTTGDQAAQGYSLQQNEILYRGMASLREDFLLMALAYHVPIDTISDLLIGYAQETSVWASQQQGIRSASFGVSLPAMLSGALADSASRSYGTGTGVADSTGAAHSVGSGISDGYAHSTGHATSVGGSHTINSGTSSSTGTGTSDGTSVTDTDSHSSSSSSSHTDSSGTSGATSHSASDTWGFSGGLSAVVASLNGSHSWGTVDSSMAGWSQGNSDSTMSGSTSGSAHAEGVSHGVTASQSQGVSAGESFGESWSSSDSVSDSVSHGTSSSVGDTSSQGHTNASSQSWSDGLGHTTSSGLAVGVAPSFSMGNSAQWQNDPAILITEIMRTQEKLLRTASIEGAYYTDLYALTSTERGLQAMMGLLPESFQGTEEVVTGVQCRTLNDDENQYIRAHAQAWTPSTRVETIPGALSGYMDSTLLTMLQLAAYTSPGVFEQGMAQTTQEETPKFAFFPDMPGDVVLGNQWSVENGELTNVMLRLSRDRHFHTAFLGDSGFGKTVAAERLAYGTTAAWHFRTIVLDFGQGWRKALNWPGLKGRVDIRQLFPGAKRPMRWNFLKIPRRIDPGRYVSLISELFANAGQMGARQLGFMRRALTELYSREGVLILNIQPYYSKKIEALNAQFTKLAKSAQATLDSQDDERKPKKNFAASAERLVDERAALESRMSELLTLDDEEATALGIPAGTDVLALSSEKQQMLATLRSKRVSVSDWLDLLRAYYEEVAASKDQASRTSLEGVLLRLEQFGDSQMLAQYGPGDDSLAVEDLGLLGPEDDQWGVTVVEGGAEMDEFAKSALLSLMAVILYLDAIVRRRESLAGEKFPPMQIFFEEANKVLSGVGGGAASDSEKKSGGSVAEIFQTMWRDGRKYFIYLHLMGQTAAELPPGILASCANMFVFQTKDGKDRDTILPHLARSEKGIVNTEYKRYLARIPRTMAIAKLGYSMDVLDLEPALIQPLLLAVDEPADAEIVISLQ